MPDYVNDSRSPEAIDDLERSAKLASDQAVEDFKRAVYGDKGEPEGFAEPRHNPQRPNDSPILSHLYDKWIGDDPIRQASYENAKLVRIIDVLRYDKAVLLLAIRKVLAEAYDSDGHPGEIDSAQLQNTLDEVKRKGDRLHYD